MAQDNNTNIDWPLLLKTLKADASLKAEEKAELEAATSHEDFKSKLLYGVYGTGLAYLISSYLKLGKTSQVLLSIAGFGLGRLVYDQMHRKDKSVTFNKEYRRYEVN